MKRIFTALLAIGLMFSVAVNAQTKRVLLEQHTGAWCGWCVDGTVKMDEILTKYPNQVIGVKFHNGDKMVIPEQATLAGQMGLTGYPTGSVDRMVFNVGGANAIFLDRGAWMQASEIAMGQAPVVDVSSFYQYNSATRGLTITVVATTLASNVDEWAFNAYICEDDVVGSGTGYDQANYLSGRAGFESSPYYTKPNPVLNYHHMKVVRAVLGGAWGTSGKIAKGTPAGTQIEHTYSYTLPTTVNANNIFIVGLVQKYDPAANGNRQILNCVKAEQGFMSSKLTSTGPSTGIVDKSAKFNKTFTLQNTAPATVVFKVELQKSARTPADWTATVNGSALNIQKGNTTQSIDVSLAPNATQQLAIEATVGNSTGMGDFTLVVSEKSNQKGYKSMSSITLASSDIQALQVVDDGEAGKYSLSTMLTQTGHTNYININGGEVSTFAPNLTQLKSIIWNTGEMGTVTNEEAQAIRSLINQGKGIILSGGFMASSLSTASPNVLDQLSARFTKVCFQGATTANVNLIGYDGDPITNKFNQAGKLIYYLTQGLASNGSNCIPLIRHRDVDTVIGIRSVVGSTRAIVLGFNPSIITDGVARNNFLDKCVKWVEGTMAEIAIADETVLFPKTEVGQTTEKTIKIENKGKENLVITDMVVDYESSHIFKVKGATTLTVPGGETKDVILTFKPPSKVKYTSFITFTSNSSTGTEFNLPLEGTGVPATSDVQDDINLAQVQLNLGPNPSTEKTLLSMGVTGSPKSIEIKLISSNGSFVSSITNGNFEEGNYTFDLQTGNYSAGTYFVVASVNGISKQIPLVIIK